MKNGVSPRRVFVKGLLLFAIFELALISLKPTSDSVNAYAVLGLQRQRFPISTSAPTDGALDVGNLDAMFVSHIVSRPKGANEFRVMVLGDSATWGIGMTPEETLPGQLDALSLQCGNKSVRVYNLSYPRSSATKDLMILDKAMQYQADLIIWLVTWYTLMPKTRVDHWLVTQNPAEFYKLGSRFDFLPKDFQPPNLGEQVYDRERSLYRETRYQLYSFVQLATDVDQIPGPPEVLPQRLGRDTTFEDMRPPTLHKSQVSLDQVQDFVEIAGKVPVLMINEPILVLNGVPNSDVRYNYYYPRWIYDQYRQYLGEAAAQNNWDYLDLWNSFAPSFFTDTPLHLKPSGEKQLAESIAPAVEKTCP